MRILIAQPGLHRVARGAEAAFEALAVELSRGPDTVIMCGAGESAPDRPYSFRKIAAAKRERFARWPSLPLLRSPYMIEDLSFAPGLARTLRGLDYDVSLTADFPYTNLALRHGRGRARRRPAVFVTQNGDWGPRRLGIEGALFKCDGLVCTNPVYYERNRRRWLARLIPNGVDIERFAPGPGDRARLGLPGDMPLVLMVSALSGTKRVDAGIRAVAGLPNTGLVVAGAGPDGEALAQLAGELMPGRYFNLALAHHEMPLLYRSVDTFVHLSLFESFGNVYIEALAAGLPIVAHDYAVTRWILGDHGHLIDTENIGILRDALSAALSGAEPSGERAAAAARFSWTSVARDYREFLEDVVNSN